jgi:molybdate transport system substrate-binding protein
MAGGTRYEDRPHNGRRAVPLDPIPSRRAVLGALTALTLAPHAAAAGPRVLIFAAASLKSALDEILPTLGAEASYGASSVIARQIEAEAPADLFISADTDWMDYLATRGLIRTATRRNLLTNRLVLIAPAASRLTLKIVPGMNLAGALGGGRLAVGGPDVPAGRYAQAALTALGAWSGVKDHLAQGENVRATLAFVARGEAPLGIVYATDAAIEPAVRVIGTFPAASHAPIVYPAAVVAASRHPRADAVLTALSGARARAVFRRYGFGVI